MALNRTNNLELMMISITVNVASLKRLTIIIDGILATEPTRAYMY